MILFAENSLAMASNSAVTATVSGVDLQATESARGNSLAAHFAMSSLLDVVFPLKKPDPDFPPILQIFDIWKGRDEQNEDDQVRLILTDGHNLQRALLTHEARNIILKSINPGSVVQLTLYTLHPPANDWEKNRLIKIIDMEIVAKFHPIAETLRYFKIGGHDEWHYWCEEDWDESHWGDPEPWEVKVDKYAASAA